MKVEEGNEPESDADSEDAEAKKSKKKRKLEARLKIAELKQSCPRPEVVEVWDVTAQDPKLLVYLKASLNLTKIIPPNFAAMLLRLYVLVSYHQSL